MKILVFCSDLLPLPGLPTSGGGLRCWQLIRALEDAGHQVVRSMPLFTFHGKRHLDSVPAEYAVDAWTIENQDELVRRHQPDAILFTSTWIVDHLHQPYDGFRIYDLDGPQLLEMHYKGDLQPSVSIEAKVERLSRADFVFFAGQRQRYYFWPILLLAGFSAELLDASPVIPIALTEPPPTHVHLERPEIIVAGGFYPWQDPRPGLSSLDKFLKHQPEDKLRVRVIGTSHGVTGTDDEQFREIQQQLSRHPHVEFLDFVPHEQLTEICRHASFAFELHACNPERLLAVTTRTVDALWTGLPVLYNNYGELSGWIEQYQAGWTVDPTDAGAIESMLDRIMADPEDLRRRSENAQRLVREQFFDSQVATPLLKFLERPVKRQKFQPSAIVDSQTFKHLKECEAQWTQAQRSRSYLMARRVASIRQVWRNVKRDRG